MSDEPRIVRWRRLIQRLDDAHAAAMEHQTSDAYHDLQAAVREADAEIGEMQEARGHSL